MEINLKEIYVDNCRRNGSIRIIPLGDIHLGNKGCDINQVKAKINFIKNTKDCYWLGMGDYIDCINYTDIRFDPLLVPSRYLKNLSNSVKLQIEDIIELFEPIKDKCLGLHRGNHEEKIRLQYHYDLMYELDKAFDFKIPMLKDSSLLRIIIKNKGGHSALYDIFSIHGNVGGRKAGNKINRLDDMTGFIDADIYLMGHSHKKMIDMKDVIYIDKNLNIKRKTKILGVTGSFLHGYCEGHGSYLEKWNYPPSTIGCIELILNTRIKGVKIIE